MTEGAARAPRAAYGWSAARWADELAKAEFRVYCHTERYWAVFHALFLDQRRLDASDAQWRVRLREERKLKNRLETAKHSLECVRRITRKLKRVYWLPELGMPKPPGGQESGNDNDSAGTPREEAG